MIWMFMFTHMGEEEILNHRNCGKSRSCCNCTAVFTQHYRHQLLVLLDKVDMPSRALIRNMQLLKTKFHKMAFWMTQKSLSIAFFVILDQYAFIYFFKFWMTENHFRSFFSRALVSLIPLGE